jgi:hypothetical protein
MFSSVSKTNKKDAARVHRMSILISRKHCESAMSAGRWSWFDRFLYRGMRAMFFHRDLAVFQNRAKNALRRELEDDADLWHAAFLYAAISYRIWMLRFRSVGFVFGMETDARESLELLFARQALR